MGDPDLQEVLMKQIPTIWCLAGFGNCFPEIQYFDAQLQLIEFAQMFVKNKVDTATLRAESMGRDSFNSSNFRDTSMRREGQGTRCSWSKSTSFQQSLRDSQQRTSAHSDGASDSQGESNSKKYDRSQRVAGGWANSYDHSQTYKVDNFVNTSVLGDRRHSESEGGTTDPPHAATGSWIQSNLDSWDFQFTSNTPFFEIPFLGIALYWPVWPPSFSDAISSGFNRQDPRVPDCTGPEESQGGPGCEAAGIPSYGESFDGRTSVSLSIGVGSVGASAIPSFTYSGDFRQSFTCEVGCSAGRTDGNTVMASDNREEFDLHGDTLSHDESEDVRDAHASASSYRNASTSLNAGSNDKLRAESKAENGSDSSSHGQGQTTAQGSADGLSHSEGIGHNKTDSSSEGLVQKWSQISTALHNLWKLVWEEKDLAQSTRDANVQPAFGVCRMTVPMKCNPKAARFPQGFRK